MQRALGLPGFSQDVWLLQLLEGRLLGEEFASWLPLDLQTDLTTHFIQSFKELFKCLLCINCWGHEGEEGDTVPDIGILGFSELEEALREHPVGTQWEKLRLSGHMASSS